LNRVSFLCNPTMGPEQTVESMCKGFAMAFSKEQLEWILDAREKKMRYFVRFQMTFPGGGLQQACQLVKGMRSTAALHSTLKRSVGIIPPSIAIRIDTIEPASLSSCMPLSRKGHLEGAEESSQPSGGSKARPHRPTATARKETTAALDGKMTRKFITCVRYLMKIHLYIDSL